MSKKVRNILIHELFFLIIILLLGALFIYDPAGSKSFSYPLQMRPEWKERFAILGWFIVYGGYPVRITVKIFLWTKNQKK
ncbi:MAG: hypothetical protein KAH95_02900 [Spirochaetales bacterium]|nr:hypothetical protein [Spirochaetales bacterium]